MILHQGAAQLLVRLAGAEQHAIGHDHRRPAAELEQLQKQRHEQQLGFPGLHHPLQLAAGALVIERACEGRIGQNQGVLVLLSGAVFRERIAVAHIGVLHPMQAHVHRPDAQHRVVEIEAMEQAMVEVLQQLRIAEQIRMVLT